MKNIIDAFETGLYPKFKNLCEPQLGKRNLYTVKFSKKILMRKNYILEKIYLPIQMEKEAFLKFQIFCKYL